MKNLSTKTKILIGAGVVLTIFIVFLLILCGSASANKQISQEDLQTNISGITCQYDGGEDLTFDISTITNDAHFDNSLVSRNFNKIKINTTKDFKTLGLGLIVKPTVMTNFTFTLYKNSEELATDTFELDTNAVKTVDLHLEESVDITTADEFYITIQQETKNPFAFDTFVFFFDEV